MEQFHHAFHGVFIPGEGGFHRPVGRFFTKPERDRLLALESTQYLNPTP